MASSGPRSEVLLVEPPPPAVDLGLPAPGNPPEPDRRGEGDGETKNEAGEGHEPDRQRRSVLDVEQLGENRADDAQREVDPPGEVGDAALAREPPVEELDGLPRAIQLRRPDSTLDDDEPDPHGGAEPEHRPPDEVDHALRGIERGDGAERGGREENRDADGRAAVAPDLLLGASTDVGERPGSCRPRWTAMLPTPSCCLPLHGTPERLARPSETDRGVLRGDAHDLGDLRMRESLERQGQDLPLPERSVRTCQRSRSVRCCLDSSSSAGGRGSGKPDQLAVGARGASRALPGSREASVVGDAKDEGLRRALAPEAGKGLPDREQDLLRRGRRAPRPSAHSWRSGARARARERAGTPRSPCLLQSRAPVGPNNRAVPGCE